MTLAELNNLSFDNIGSWPVVVKIVFILIVCSGILGLAYWKDINPLREDLAKAQVEETELKVTFEGRQKKAANLNALKQQLEDIKETFGDLLKRLPNKTEVAALLVDISQQGLGAGLEFELFKPDFYVELPIKITVVGDYHEFGNFISGVSDLPRIVTNHDVRIRPQGEGRLVMQTVAKTYRYMDEEEEAGQ